MTRNLLGPSALLALAGAAAGVLAGGEDPVPKPGEEREESASGTCPINQRFLDLVGALHVVGEDREARGTALVLLGQGCPISDRTLPELKRIAQRAGELDVTF